MELTKSELEIADRCLSKCERQLAQWPHKRWLVLLLFSMLALLGYRTVGDGMRSIHDDKAMDLQVDRAFGDAPPPGEEHLWTVGSMMKISKILELRYQVVTYASMEVALGYLGILSGVSMLCLTVLRWNTGERDALICGLLRAKLQELEQAKSDEPGAGARVDNRIPAPADR